MSPSPTVLAAADSFEVGRPLFGSQWLALLAVLALIAIFMAAVALLGRWLAATHPEPPAKPARPAPAPVVTAAVNHPPVVAADVGSDTVKVILAAVAEFLGSRAHVSSIRCLGAAKPVAVSVEALMQQWSQEGRRQIYSSHKVR